jgi:hypothetical protein
MKTTVLIMTNNDGNDYNDCNWCLCSWYLSESRLTVVWTMKRYILIMIWISAGATM